jgi:hypothetical protein
MEAPSRLLTGGVKTPAGPFISAIEQKLRMHDG